VIRATLNLRLCKKQLVESVARALQPDNERPPSNFKIKHLINSKCELAYLIEGRSENIVRDLLTLLSVVDEISRLTEALKTLFKELNEHN